MALIQCERCGQTVSNTGKCPKCGTLICIECGHSLAPKDVKCPNCGKGTDYLAQKFRTGWILLIVGTIMVLFLHFPSNSGFVIFMNWVNLIAGLTFFVIGLRCIWKYGKIRHYS